MKEEKMIQAIGQIDEALTEEADRKRTKKKGLPLRAIGAACACFLILAICICTAVPLMARLKDEATKEKAEGAGAPTDETHEQIEGDNEEICLQTSTNDPENQLSDNAGSVAGNEVPEAESITGETVYALPLFVTVVRCENDRLICKINDTMGNESFKKGADLTVILSEDTVMPQWGVEAGDSVYVSFSTNKNDTSQVSADKIYFEAGDTTPALW